MSSVEKDEFPGLRDVEGLRDKPVCWKCQTRTVRATVASPLPKMCFRCRDNEDRHLRKFREKSGPRIVTDHGSSSIENVTLDYLIATQGDEIHMESGGYSDELLDGQSVDDWTRDH